MMAPRGLPAAMPIAEAAAAPAAAARAPASPLEAAVAANAHLADYLARWRTEHGETPQFTPSLDRSLGDRPHLSVIYPLGDPCFVHIQRREGETRYIVIEPPLDSAGEEAYGRLQQRILELAPLEEPARSTAEQEALLGKLFARALQDRARSVLGGPLQVAAEIQGPVWYRLRRDVLGHGPLQPLLHDPYIEDIHGLGPRDVACIHKVFGPCATTVDFGGAPGLDAFLKGLGDRLSRPVSESAPIVDATLVDGSRINVVYSPQVSRRGSSFTIRRFSDKPLTIPQLIKFGTMSPQLAAYLWLCLENGVNVWVSGETASGKTSSLNALLAFVPHHLKILTAEDTPEVVPPHEVWQQLVTRERGPESGRVTMYDLLRAALRSRPNLIVVGEIRGAEGNVAFQAMQTGTACMATFHASSVGKLIQRLSSDPINVPATFLDNLNVAIIQMAVYRQGKLLRRVLAVEEIEGYDKKTGGVVTRRVFEWDPRLDKHDFRGQHNSYVLESKVAERLGYADKRKIYADLAQRTAILQEMVRRGITEYYDVARLLAAFQKHGLAALPFPVPTEVPA